MDAQRAWERDEAQALAGLVALFTITAAWWMLALWPVQDGPEWLERTRYVCFGVAASGLPDAGGWIGLIGGPLGMLAILGLGWQGGMRALLHRSRRSRGVALTLRALAAGCVLLVCGAAMRVQQARAATGGSDDGMVVAGADLPRMDLPAPPLDLVTQHGDTLDPRVLSGRPVLVTFAFAHCTTVCPLVVSDALRAQALVRGRGRDVAVAIITLDPWRDTPSRLSSMATAWGVPAEDAWVLGGSVTDVERSLDAWAVPRTRDVRTGEVTHPSLLYVVDGAGRIAYASSGGVEAIVSLVMRL